MRMHEAKCSSLLFLATGSSQSLNNDEVKITMQTHHRRQTAQQLTRRTRRTKIENECESRASFERYHQQSCDRVELHVLMEFWCSRCGGRIEWRNGSTETVIHCGQIKIFPDLHSTTNRDRRIYGYLVFYKFTNCITLSTVNSNISAVTHAPSYAGLCLSTSLFRLFFEHILRSILSISRHFCAVNWECSTRYQRELSELRITWRGRQST